MDAIFKKSPHASGCSRLGPWATFLPGFAEVEWSICLKGNDEFHCLSSPRKAMKGLLKIVKICEDQGHSGRFRDIQGPFDLLCDYFGRRSRNLSTLTYITSTERMLDPKLPDSWVITWRRWKLPMVWDVGDILVSHFKGGLPQAKHFQLYKKQPLSFPDDLLLTRRYHR